MSNGFVPGPPQSPTQLPSPAFSPLPPPLPNDRHIRRGQEEYAFALSNLLPQGIAWPRWPDATLMKVVYGLSGIMGWADGRAADLLEIESDPRATTEMLDSWERAWGLPEPCMYPQQLSFDERRRLLVLKMTLLGAQSREFFYGVADFLGYSISITEYRPFMVGVDRCGDNRTHQADGTLSDWPCQIGSPTMRFCWTVHLQQPKLVWFRVGSGQCGIDPHLRIAKALDLECLIHKWAPGHTLPLFDYSGISDPLAGADAFYVLQRDGQQVVTRATAQVINDRPTSIMWPQAPNAYYVGSPAFATPIALVALAPADPATANWMNTVVSKGGTVSTARQQQIDFLVKNLKADGVWPQLDRLWIFDAENAQQETTDLVVTASATNVGAGFMANVGFTSGASSYVNSNFNPLSALAPNFTRNGASLGVWIAAAPSGGSGFFAGQLTGSGTNPWRIYIDVNDGQTGISWFGINDANGTASTFKASTLPYGLFVVDRVGATNSQAWLNGIEMQFSSNPSVAPFSSPITFGQANGSPGMGTMSIGFIGGDLTQAQHKALYTHLRTFLTGIGHPPGTPPVP